MLLTAAISGAYGVKIQGMLWKSYLQWMHSCTCLCNNGNKVEFNRYAVEKLFAVDALW